MNEDMIFQVMLAKDADLNKIRFPLLASAKLDGVRAYVREGVVYSRKNKPIPNAYVQSLFSHLEHHDGELIVGSATSKTCYRDTMSGVMSRSGEPDVFFHVFDHVEVLNATYFERAKRIRKGFKRVEVVEQRLIKTGPELYKLEQLMLDVGYEGLILRSPDAPYKLGRSTVNEGYLLKMKRFVDAEFEVVGYEERMHNGNAATVDETGRTKRSSHKAGKVGLGDLGALVLQGDGFTFNVGTGFDDATRKALWEIRDTDLIGRLAKIKYFPVGVKDAPRHPVFLGWRDRRDT